MDVALKEWDTVVRLLAEGRCRHLLRKGGIDDAGGVFRLGHDRFLLWPTFVHQRGEMLQPWATEWFRPDEEPADVHITAAAEVETIEVVRDRGQLEAMGEALPWNGAYLDMRFGYKPEKPLYLLTLRAWKLDEPLVFENTP
ncbi:MAG: DUF1802 family protein, partial [Planctomycetota bacterium]